MMSLFKDPDKIVLGSEDLLSDIRFRISTGMPVLDVYLGGGFPSGRMVEVFGAESSGKSTLVTQVAKQCLEDGGVVYFIDHEATFDRDYATQMGLDVNRMVFLNTLSVEDTIETILVYLENKKAIFREDLFKCKKCSHITIDGKQCSECGGKKLPLAPEDDRRFPALIIWDTLAASPTRKALKEHDYDKGREVALKQRIMSDSITKLTHRLSKADTCLCFVNQVRDKIGGYQGGTLPPGGRAVRHHCSFRLDLAQIGKLFDESTAHKDTKFQGIQTGIRCRIRTKKTKLRSPPPDLDIPLYFGKGFDDRAALLDVFLRSGLANRSGGWYYLEIELTDKQLLAIQGLGYTAGREEDGKSFIKWQGAKRFEDMIASAKGIVPLLYGKLKDAKGYI
jgi:recombination protein RecA